jgi:hypothetical protein
MLWIYDLPNWLLCVLILVVFVGAALAGQLLTQRLVHHFLSQALEDHNEAVGAFISAFGVFYGIMLGLVAIATWQNYKQLEDLVGQEAAAVGALDRDVGALPEPAGDELRALLRDYVNFIIDRSWPEYRRGRIPRDDEVHIEAFRRRLTAFEPKTERESVLFAASFDQFNKALELHRKRLSNVGSRLPAVLWAVVLAGAVINVILLYVLRIEPLRTHLLLTGLLSTFIGLMIFLIAALDHPFLGEVSVDAGPFEALRQGQMAPALSRGSSS